MNTIQERNRRLYLVKQNDGQFEYYPTIYTARDFRATFGNHDGEQVEPGNVEGVWKSLDGQRRYVLAELEPEWVEGVQLDVAETPRPPVSESKPAASQNTKVEDIPNKEEEKSPAKPKRPSRKTRRKKAT